MIMEQELCCLVAKLCPTLCDPIECSTWSFPVLHCLPEFVQTHAHWVSDATQSSCPLSAPLPPASIFPSIRVFSNESALHIRWPEYWSFSFSISPANEYSGLISFRINLFDLLALQATLNSLLQHHNSKASVLWRSAFFRANSYICTWIQETPWPWLHRRMSLLFKRLYRFVIAFIPRSKPLFISWLQSLSTVILEPRKIKSVTVSTLSSSICHEVMGLDAMILVCWMLSFKPVFSLSSFTFIKRLFSSSLSAIRVVSVVCLRLLIFLLAILIAAWNKCNLRSLS